jgi:hypothetical protein
LFIYNTGQATSKGCVKGRFFKNEYLSEIKEILETAVNSGPGGLIDENIIRLSLSKIWFTVRSEQRHYGT